MADDVHTPTPVLSRPVSAAEGPHAVADALAAELTLDEKIAMLHQHAPAVERLGLAPFHTGTEALHGLAWLGVATVFPQPVGLAASWDDGLLARVGEAVAAEVRARHVADPSVSLNVWAPVVNSLRHPLWGRNEEGYSEDADLTASLATAYCRGLRGRHPSVWSTVPTLKHLLGYGNETDRAVTSSHLPPQSLREVELPAFAGPLASGAVGAVMPSYNLVNGRPSHVSGELLDEVRRWAPHDIAVVSDAQAPSNLVDGEFYLPDHVTAHAAALRAGVDSFTENAEDPVPTRARLTDALAAGLITEADIDAAVRRLLGLRARTGEFDPDAEDLAPAATHHDAAHVALAREAASRGVVVLENRDGTLPATTPRRIAVVGPYAERAAQDWYSGTPPYQSTLAGALGERHPDAEVRVADGADRIALFSRRTGRYLRRRSDARVVADALEARSETLWDRTDWGDGVVTLRAADTGRLLAGADWILRADAERVGGWVTMETFHPRTHHDGTVSLRHIGRGTWLRTQHGSGLLVADGTEATAERFDVHLIASGAAHVAAACEGADLAIITVGNEPHIAGRETEDRVDLGLPAPQRALVRAAAAAADRSVLTIVSSYPYAVADEAAAVDAVVWTSHAGQEFGHGLVDVLSGDVEPSGRLAQTWWRCATDAGDLFDYDVVGSAMTYRYSQAQPLYPLGHGLGYSRVDYASLSLSCTVAAAPPPTTAHAPARQSGDDAARDEHGRADDLVVRVRVRNTGDRTADELVAVWALAPDLAVPAPRRRLAGWSRVRLQPGEAREVAVTVPVGILAVWDVACDGDTTTPGAFRVQPGVYRFAAGPSATEPAVQATFTVTGEEPAPRRVGVLPAHGFHRHDRLVTSDRTRAAGHSIEVQPGAEEGVAEYHRIDLSDVTGLQLTVARRALPARQPATVTVQHRPAGATHWRRLAGPFAVDAEGPYDWRTTRSLGADPAAGFADAGAGDLRVVLTGAARLAEVAFAR